MTNRWMLLIGVGALALGGCTTMRGAPPNVLDESESSLRVKVDEQLVTRIVDRQFDDQGNRTIEQVSEQVRNVTGYRTLVSRQEIIDYSVGLSNAEERKEFRNRVIDHYMGEMDRHYERYSQRLFGEGIELALGFDTAIIGLASTAALFESSATDLATVISGFAGVQSAINKNLYFDRTLPALIVTMDTERTKVETEIVFRKAQSTADYTLEAAIRDLRRYQQAGTLMRAVTKVTEVASDEKQRAEDQYEQTLGIACAPDESLSEEDQILIGDAIIDNYNAAVDNDDAAAEVRLRAIAQMFGTGAQGELDDVFLGLTNAWQSKYCTQTEVEALKSKLEPFLGE